MGVLGRVAQQPCLGRVGFLPQKLDHHRTGLLRYHSTTGLDPARIRELIARIRQTLPDPDRRTGRPPALSLYRSVLLTLVLLRQNLPQTLAADLFGVSQPTVSRTLRRYAPLIGRVLRPHTPSLPDLLPRLSTVLLDGTLIPTGNRAHPDPHPTDGTRRRPHPNYNGKHREQGLSVQILTDHAGRLLAVLTPQPGSTHDSRAYHHHGLADLLHTTPTIADLGYQGTDAIIPRRKRPGHTHHTPADQAWNTLISRHRWPVERAIAHLKNWKILATGYRARLTELPTIIRIVTNLEFYRLSQRHF
ncbi:transposase family protein [Actinosynnema sp. NPDC053489]|uniref:transposase family protein n=1 Tax=Actinosynnema sp. NPDC053489 TaxID=3363916 RepID=UPI0037CBEE0D